MPLPIKENVLAWGWHKVGHIWVSFNKYRMKIANKVSLLIRNSCQIFWIISFSVLPIVSFEYQTWIAFVSWKWAVSLLVWYSIQLEHSVSGILTVVSEKVVILATSFYIVSHMSTADRMTSIVLPPGWHTISRNDDCLAGFSIAISLKRYREIRQPLLVRNAIYNNNHKKKLVIKKTNVVCR